MTADDYPSSDDSYSLLHRSGWTIGETACLDDGRLMWLVSGHNGENLITTEGETRAEAWYHACGQARAVGMLAREVGLAPF